MTYFICLSIGAIIGWIACALCCNNACQSCRDALRYLNGLGEK